MAAHLLVEQLRFARSEFKRGLEGVSEEDAVKRLGPMNCISWIVGHMANQETRYWLLFAQKQELHPELKALVGYGSPASTPPLTEMWAAWEEITQAADRYLDTLTPQTMVTFFERNGRRVSENVGTLLLRTIYHYWYHTGEAAAIRQLLGHTNLPEFVGDMAAYMYHPED